MRAIRGTQPSVLDWRIWQHWYDRFSHTYAHGISIVKLINIVYNLFRSLSIQLDNVFTVVLRLLAMVLNTYNQFNRNVTRDR